MNKPECGGGESVIKKTDGYFIFLYKQVSSAKDSENKSNFHLWDCHNNLIKNTDRNETWNENPT